MNIARVEYYFAEMLSVLEIPARDEWNIELVTSAWPDDPKKIVRGKLRLPGNLWYIGTINNDDSTFLVTDKVYDRAIPINIDSKGKFFEAPITEAIRLDYRHLESMFEECKQQYKVSAVNLNKINTLDDYVIEHFRIAFGNRIMKQLNTFAPVYVACGGKEIEAIDYFFKNNKRCCN